jgi:D-alanyl-D-alanine carboxypeptidase (penicillin-binding protein 5/6)
MKNTHFTNSSGLPDEKHYSTMRDIALLTQAIIRDFPEYMPYFAELEFAYNDITQANRNILLGEGGVDGMKTGHTDSGGYGLAATAKQENVRLIGVVNGLDSEKSRAMAAEALLKYGFFGFRYETLYNENDKVKQIDFPLGQPTTLDIGVSQRVSIIVPRTVETHQEEIICNTEALPIKQGQKVCELTVKAGEEVVATVDLVALHDVTKTNVFTRAWRAFMSFIGYLKFW